MPFFPLRVTGGGRRLGGVVEIMSCLGDWGFSVKKRTTLVTRCDTSIECLTSTRQEALEAPPCTQ